MGMLAPRVRPPDLLGFCLDGKVLSGLHEALSQEGMQLEIASNLEEVRHSFFRSGGHRMLILGPDLPTTLAQTAAQSLYNLDPELAIVVFGRKLTNCPFAGHVTRVPAFHPSSRAGIGAILKVLKQSS